MQLNKSEPIHGSYDVVIIGGAMIGTSVAWHLSAADFHGRVLVVERDPSYEFAATSHSNSCMRQQFSSHVNIHISQYAADFVRNFRDHIRDHKAPSIPVHHFGYMYLANTNHAAEQLRQRQLTQSRLGVGTEILSPDQIKNRFGFYNLDDIILGSFNNRDEGYFDAQTICDWWRRKARKHGTEFIHNEVTAIGHSQGRLTSITLKSGQIVPCGVVVNAAGARAAQVAKMAGLDIPVEPRKRYTYVFDAQNPLEQDLPLSVDPSGVHVRSDGNSYMAGSAPVDDPPVAVDDFEMDHNLWESKVWPTIAHRIPAFETVKLRHSWVGHYAYNRLDQNAIVGPHPDVENLIFVNGFSGHGLQQAPAMGRGVAELIMSGGYQTLDLSVLGVARLLSGQALMEGAVI